MKETRATIMHPDDLLKDRTLLVKEAQQLLNLNEKIKAAIMLNKIQKFSLLSQHIKRRVLGSKVKRTIEMRERYHRESIDRSDSIKFKKISINQSSLSIDATELPQPQSPVHKGNSPTNSPKRRNGLGILNSNQFKSIGDTPSKSLNVNGTRTLEQPGRIYHSVNKKQTLESPKVSPQTAVRFFPSKVQTTIHPKSQQDNTPFVLKNRTKKQMRKFEYIGRRYSKKIATIEQISKFQEEQRKSKSKAFINRIRNPRLYYQMMEQVRCPFNPNTIQAEMPDIDWAEVKQLF